MTTLNNFYNCCTKVSKAYSIAHSYLGSDKTYELIKAKIIGLACTLTLGTWSTHTPNVFRPNLMSLPKLLSPQLILQYVKKY